MYANQSFHPNPHKSSRIDRRLERTASYTARQAKLTAWVRETDLELAQILSEIGVGDGVGDASDGPTSAVVDETDSKD